MVNDGSKDRDRVRPDFEELERYDADFYAENIIRAAESVLSPMG
ncbi:MAG: hypothetical protein SVS85_00160 [Candidatus Nanohaloarchaea archaeon]|nr:hypothetical protein [Candidatus Nanohaloarchaea archaeon]